MIRVVAFDPVSPPSLGGDVSHRPRWPVRRKALIVLPLVVPGRQIQTVDMARAPCRIDPCDIDVRAVVPRDVDVDGEVVGVACAWWLSADGEMNLVAEMRPERGVLCLTILCVVD